MSRRNPPQRVRIIGGRWRRTPLPVVEAAGLRPTPDRVRETVFNWLGQDLHGLRCADLFAGTGALGLEAASRGALHVWLAETAPAAQRALAEIIDRLDASALVDLHRGDANSLLRRLDAQGVRLDVVFLDPPFHQGALDAVMPGLRGVLADPAIVYVESERPITDTDLVGWFGSDARIVRQGSAGQVHYHLLRKEAADDRPREPT